SDRPPWTDQPPSFPPAWPRQGTLIAPLDLDHLLSLPITGPIEPKHLEPTTLIVLLRRICGRRGVSGNLRLRAQGHALEFTLEAGEASLGPAELRLLRTMFTVPTGRWELRAKVASSRPDVPAHSLRRLAIEGLRQALDGIPKEELEHHYRRRQDETVRLTGPAPTIGDELGLTAGEMASLNALGPIGAASIPLSEFGRGEVGSAASLRLVAFLQLHGALEVG
ncbi:MAG: hypothetical protein AAGA56_12200, partial [Myxococcota bacterium]